LREPLKLRVTCCYQEKKEALIVYIEERIHKDFVNLNIDVMSTGKQPVQLKDVEALLTANGLGGLKVEEKKNLSTSTTGVFRVAIKSRDQGLKLLSIEGAVIIFDSRLTSQ
jgi:hypothetical protein